MAKANIPKEKPPSQVALLAEPNAAPYWEN